MKIVLVIHYLKVSLKVLSSWIVLFVWTDQVQAGWSEILADTEFSYLFQDNINRAVFESEEENDHVLNASASLGKVFQLTNSTRIFFNAHFDVSGHDNFDRLNQIKTGASLTARHKIGVGAFQPWVSSTMTTHHLFSRSRIREGQITTIGIDFGKRLHDRLDMSLNYRYDLRVSNTPATISASKLLATGTALGKSSSVFDLSGHSIGTQFNILITQQWLLILTYNFRDGDIVSSSSPALISNVNGIIDAIANDDALPGWAYRAKAQTHRYSIDANYAFLKGHAAFNLGYEYTESHASPFTYRNNLFRMNVIYNF